jgi:hypothetical protein
LPARGRRRFIKDLAIDMRDDGDGLLRRGRGRPYDGEEKKALEYRNVDKPQPNKKKAWET